MSDEQPMDRHERRIGILTDIADRVKKAGGDPSAQQQYVPIPLDAARTLRDRLKDEPPRVQNAYRDGLIDGIKREWDR